MAHHGGGRRAGEDPRYEALLADAPATAVPRSVRRVFVVQGLAAWFVSLPLQVVRRPPTGRSAGSRRPAPLVWLVGVVFEGVGDAQLAAFKRDPANRGTVMDRGLWSWTRHPNYFGDFGRVVGALARGGERLARAC